MTRKERAAWFADLGERLDVAVDPKLNLVVEVGIAQDRFSQMQQACLAYIAACLGVGVTSMPEERMLQRAEDLANRTPNGILVPKQEFQAEFNQLHQSVAVWLASLSIDNMITEVYSPVIVRLVKGEREPSLESRPYASTKLHTDLWGGDPPDSVNGHIPILGDIERTTIDFFHPPDDFEEHWFQALDNYDNLPGFEERCQIYPIQPRLGYAYFADTITPHRTVKNNGRARAMLEFRFCRTITDVERNELQGFVEIERLSRYVDLHEWYTYGKDRFMRFKDTYADAARGVFTERPSDEHIYDLVDSLQQ